MLFWTGLIRWATLRPDTMHSSTPPYRINRCYLLRSSVPNLVGCFAVCYLGRQLTSLGNRATFFLSALRNSCLYKVNALLCLWRAGNDEPCMETLCISSLAWHSSWNSIYILQSLAINNNFLLHKLCTRNLISSKAFCFVDHICYVLCLFSCFSWTTILPPYESKILLLRAQQLTRGANKVHPVYTITNLLIFTQLFNSLLSSSLSLVDTFLYYS